MYQLPPSIDNFTGVFALILLAQSISIARDYCNETLRTTDEPAGFLIRNQCEVAIKSALRPALLVYFGIALLSFDSRLLTAGAIWTWLVDGAMKLSHAIGVAAGMVVFAYQLGNELGESLAARPEGDPPASVRNSYRILHRRDSDSRRRRLLQSPFATSRHSRSCLVRAQPGPQKPPF